MLGVTLFVPPPPPPVRKERLNYQKYNALQANKEEDEKRKLVEEYTKTTTDL